jgi:hypothetical protein
MTVVPFKAGRCGVRDMKYACKSCKLFLMWRGWATASQESVAHQVYIYTVLGWIGRTRGALR